MRSHYAQVGPALLQRLGAACAQGTDAPRWTKREEASTDGGDELRA
jgi:hypothetical protein